MAVKTTNAGGEGFEKAPEGMHVARCYKIIDCGTHINPTFGKKQRLAWVFFELPKALMTKGDFAGKPFTIGKRYGLSHNEKSMLRADLESWYGKRFDTAALDKAGGFDLEKVLGRPAMVNIIHSEDGKYANIKAINPLPEGFTCPDPVNEPFVFSLAEFDRAKFDKLSEKMQEFVSSSDEYQAMSKPEAKPAGHFDDMKDDIPF
jgi:hypothetical protein